MEFALPEAVTKVLDQSLEFIYGLEPYVAKTVVLVPGFLRTYVQSLSDKIGFDPDTLDYALGLFLCYPLGIIMNHLPYGPIRHFFSFFLGAFLLQFTLGAQWIHQLITSLAAYLMLSFLPRKTAAMVVPIFVMTYCVLGHLHRQYVNYLGWDLDFTGAQMVLTQKLHMLAFNLYDGEVLAQSKKQDESTSSSSTTKAAKKCAAFALPKLPNLFEYLGYTFCFSSVLSGPAYEFTTYAHVCDGSLFYKPDGTPRGQIPSNVWPTLKPFLVSLFCLGIYIVLGAHYPLLDPDDPQNKIPVVLRPEFLAEPWFWRYCYLWMAMFVYRQKYYFAWKNAEGSNNIWYAGFEGFDENGNPLGWENSDNVAIWEFETAPNIQTLSKEWNKKTSLWLTRYVYIRTNGSLFAVYSISAFWHGFYPGYYLFFLSVPLMTICERLGRKKISPYFNPEKWNLYGIMCIIVTSVVVEYMVSAFALLALDWSLANWKSYYFFGHIGCIIFYALVSQMPSHKVPKKKTA